MRTRIWVRLAGWGCCLWLCQGVAGLPGWCAAGESAGPKTAAPKTAAPKAAAPKPKPGAEARSPASPQGAAYSGERISLELKNADLKDFFRLIGDISGLNIVLDPDVEGALTLFLKEVPWDQALDVVLKNQGMGRHLSGNVLRIAKLSTLEAEQQQQQRLAQARLAAAEVQTRIRRPSYARAAELSPILKKALSPRGDIIVDERTNALVISDIPPRLKAVETLLRQLDRKVRQVEIEARVVAASRSFLQDIGIQWSALYGRQSRPQQQEGSSPGPAFSRFPLLDAAAAGEERPRLSLDLKTGAPASPLTLAAGLAADFVLDALITAAERKGDAKLLSKPKILTQNNVQGVVKQGVQIPIQTTVNNTVSARFIDFGLRLTVTPQIIRQDAILLSVDIENSTPDFSRQVQGIPTVNTHQTTTTIQVENGGTVMIGGILIDSRQQSRSQVPGLGDIPVVGVLFRNRSLVQETRELVFFLSPRIL